jgi:nitrite reductase (NADH) small subunit
MTNAVTLHLGPIHEIPVGEGRVYQVGGRRIAVFRTRSGDVYAADAKCPHRGGPLADGVLGGHCVVCPLHNYVFDLRTGGAPSQDCPPLTTYPIFVRTDGGLEVELP